MISLANLFSTFSSLGQMELIFFSFIWFPKDGFNFPLLNVLLVKQGWDIKSSSAHKRSLTQITSLWVLKLLMLRLIWSLLGFPLLLLSSLSTANSGAWRHWILQFQALHPTQTLPAKHLEPQLAMGGGGATEGHLLRSVAKAEHNAQRDNVSSGAYNLEALSPQKEQNKSSC